MWTTARRAVLALFCVFACLALAAAAGSEGEEEEEAVTFFTATFQPGKLGINAVWATGRVDDVPQGGQGERNGVKVGMYIFKIDGRTYVESLLDKRIAGSKEYEIEFKKFPAPKPVKPKEDDVPPRPDFKFATELTPETFEKHVTQVTNGTGLGKVQKPPYFPVVMFHVSWCKHCKFALPELEKAAQTLHEAAQQGHLHGLEAPPKFFLIECDTPAEHKVFCEKYVGTNFPVIKTFRGQRSVLFNRPRVAQTFAWWAAHVSRPPVTVVTNNKMLEEYTQGPGPVFALNDAGDDASLGENWEEVGMDHIENLYFIRVPPGTEAAKKLPRAPSVSVKGTGGFDSLPWDGSTSYESLADWVNFNQFLPIVELSPYTASSLRHSDLVIVTLMYRADSSTGARAAFEFKARQMRKERPFIFAVVDVSEEEGADYINHAFPLLAPKSESSPRIFAFSGEDTYWEDFSMMDPSAITLESIEALLASEEAKQDGSTSAWIKAKRKTVFRFSSGSTTGLIISVFVPVLALGCVWVMFKALFGEDTSEGTTKVDKAD